jgi:pullulanase/glycogen debranching enzyme
VEQVRINRSVQEAIFEMSPATSRYLQGEAMKHWYKNAVIYELDVETYLDSNGDGIGDFKGLSRCLDYLSGLG